MLIKNCRVCNQHLFDEPILQYKNMPKSAQFFPDIETLNEDEGTDLEICQCSGCGLVQLTNAPVHYYKEVIRAAGVSDEMTEFRQKQFSNWVDKYSLTGKKIIEVGCGSGEYLGLMAENNVMVFGIEQGLDSVAKCIEQDLIVRQDYIDSPTKIVNDGPFDAFFMLNFLEHIPEPNATLLGIVNNLSDEAIGLIEVPNFDMILRKNLFSEFISDHLFYFTKATFISTLNRNGFDVLECNETWHDYSLSAVVRVRRKIDLSYFSGVQKKLTNELEDFISQFSDNSVAIWGAGHQALAVMALTCLEGKIKYVVDSAPFKQGKYTPATHIPIVSPNTINSDPIEAIIIIAGSYSMEVSQVIKESYARNIKTAILTEDGLEVASE